MNANKSYTYTWLVAIRVYLREFAALPLSIHSFADDSIVCGRFDPTVPCVELGATRFDQSEESGGLHPGSPGSIAHAGANQPTLA
jgi:hypothetical protein